MSPLVFLRVYSVCKSFTTILIALLIWMLVLTKYIYDLSLLIRPDNILIHLILTTTKNTSHTKKSFPSLCICLFSPRTCTVEPRLTATPVIPLYYGHLFLSRKTPRQCISKNDTPLIRPIFFGPSILGRNNGVPL